MTDLDRLRRLEPDLATFVTHAPDAVLLDSGPFRALVSRTSHWMDVVVPVAPPTDEADVRRAIADLRARFAEYGRTPRIVFTEARFPGLATMLGHAGCRLAQREPLMICTDASFHPHRAEGVSVRFLRASDPDDTLDAFQQIWSTVLADSLWVATPGTLAAFRHELVSNVPVGAALATLDGDPVGTGFLAVYGETCEITRVATIAAARRRGVGATLSSFLTTAGLESGATLAWLTAANPEAHRIYQRIGFRFVADELTYLVT